MVIIDHLDLLDKPMIQLWFDSLDEVWPVVQDFHHILGPGNGVIGVAVQNPLLLPFDFSELSGKGITLGNKNVRIDEALFLQ